MREIKKIMESGVTLDMFEQSIHYYIREGKVFIQEGKRYKITEVVKISQDKGVNTAIVEVEQVK